MIRLQDDKETVLKDVLARVDAANADIPTFLKDVDDIEDEKVQKCCRRAAIAQMYNVYPKSIASQSNRVLVIGLRQYADGMPVISEAVVSKYGEIIIDEGLITVYSSANYGGGWPVKNIATGRFGFISNYGDYLLPCSFDTFYVKLCVGPYFFLKGVAFELRVLGKQSELEKGSFEQLLDDSCNKMRDFIVCRSDEGVLYELKVADFSFDYSGQIVDSEVDPAASQEALQEAKAFMSSFIVSQEELQQLVGDRPKEYEILDDKCIIYQGPEIKDKRFLNYDFSEVEFPDTLESIGKEAFSECKNLRAIWIPKSVTFIGECAFSLCRSLESIEVDEDNPKYRSDGNCLLTKDGKTLILGCKTSRIPDSVEHIGEKAFWSAGITSIKIPSSVSTIGPDAFAVCPDLASIEIPNSIKDYSVFDGIYSLKDIFLPSGGPLQYGGFREGFEWQVSSFVPMFAKRERQFRQKITLHVPKGTEDEYRNDDFFGTFGEIVAFD